MFDERVTAGSRLLFVLILSRSLRPGIHVPSIHTTDMHTHRRCPSNTSHRCAPAHTPSRTHPLLAEPICVCVSFKVCMRVCVFLHCDSPAGSELDVVEFWNTLALSFYPRAWEFGVYRIFFNKTFPLQTCTCIFLALTEFIVPGLMSPLSASGGTAKCVCL